VPIPFLGRRKRKAPAKPAPRPALPPDQLELEDQSLRVHFRALSSHGVRMPSDHDIPVRLSSLLEGYVQSAVELGRVKRPVAVAGDTPMPCPHCGFTALDRRAHYCPKCGMRAARG